MKFANSIISKFHPHNKCRVHRYSTLQHVLQGVKHTYPELVGVCLGLTELSINTNSYEY